MIDADIVIDALRQEAQTLTYEAEHIAEREPRTGTPLWLLASFKLVQAESLYRVAASVRKGAES